MADSASGGSGGQGDKVQYFQDVTGVDDPLLAEQILDAHQWDLHAAVGNMMEKSVSHLNSPTSVRGNCNRFSSGKLFSLCDCAIFILDTIFLQEKVKNI